MYAIKQVGTIAHVLIDRIDGSIICIVIIHTCGEKTRKISDSDGRFLPIMATNTYVHIYSWGIKGFNKSLFYGVKLP